MYNPATPSPASDKAQNTDCVVKLAPISNDAIREVVSIQPAAPYCGGKKALASQLTAQIAAIPHNTYAEPFVGMGGIFFRRRRRPKSEIINDFNGEVANFFRITQRHYPQFMDVMKFQLTSRSEFIRMKATDPCTLTDLERAVRFYYLQKTAFGGKVTGQTFGVNTGGMAARFDYSKVADLLEKIFRRLSGVVIESLPFEEFIPRYDRVDTLYYLDPPYWGMEDYYGKNLFYRTDFEKLSIILSKIKGRFIMSLNDTVDVRELFSAFQIEEVQTNYSIAQRQRKPISELIISGP